MGKIFGIYPSLCKIFCIKLNNAPNIPVYIQSSFFLDQLKKLLTETSFTVHFDSVIFKKTGGFGKLVHIEIHIEIHEKTKTTRSWGKAGARYHPKN